MFSLFKRQQKPEPLTRRYVFMENKLNIWTRQYEAETALSAFIMWMKDGYRTTGWTELPIETVHVVETNETLKIYCLYSGEQPNRIVTMSYDPFSEAHR
jgi:hypothetical protein